MDAAETCAAGEKLLRLESCPSSNLPHNAQRGVQRQQQVLLLQLLCLLLLMLLQVTESGVADAAAFVPLTRRDVQLECALCSSSNRACYCC